MLKRSLVASPLTDEAALGVLVRQQLAFLRAWVAAVVHTASEVALDCSSGSCEQAKSAMESAHQMHMGLGDR